MRIRLTFVLGMLLCLGGCTGFFFQPQRAQVRTPDEIPVAYEDVYLHAADGVRLHAWFLPAQGTVKGTILHLHGNAENISTHIGSVYWLPARGFNVFMLDYRGYGLSLGTPTLAGVQLDIDAAMATLLRRRDVDPQRIVVLGQSLGGAFAVYNVTHSPFRKHIRALVIDSTFTGFREITREKLASFWLTWPFQYPISWTVDDDYSPIEFIAQVSPIPLLIIQGEEDGIVPVHHAQVLYAAARQPKTLWIEKGVGHIRSLDKPAVRNALVEYLAGELSRSPPRAASTVSTMR